MNIGIIGAGHIGGTLARRFAALGHQVTLANSRGPESLAVQAAEAGVTPASAEQAARGRDLVVVSIPLKNIPDLPKDLFAGEPEDLPVVDTSNYYPRQRDGQIEAIESGLTESRWVELQIGHPVVKAFNNIFAKHLLELGQPAGTPNRIALPVAGDNAAAKAKVMDVIDQMGFDAVDAGTIEESWKQQPGSPVYAGDHAAEDLAKALAQARPERGSEWRFPLK
ncbi:MAG: NADPH-dependent F420 reductase [Terriglobales bacterium]